MGTRFGRAVLYGLARGPSLIFLAVFFVAAAYIAYSHIAWTFLLPFAAIAIVVMSAMVWDTFHSRTALADALSEPIPIGDITIPRLREYARRAVEYRRALRSALLARDP